MQLQKHGNFPLLVFMLPLRSTLSLDSTAKNWGRSSIIFITASISLTEADPWICFGLQITCILCATFTDYNGLCKQAWNRLQFARKSNYYCDVFLNAAEARTNAKGKIWYRYYHATLSTIKRPIIQVIALLERIYLQKRRIAQVL